MKTMVKLNKDLKKDFKRNSFPVRVGDKVKVMRGNFSGIIGKIGEIDKKTGRVKIDNVKIKKSNGTEVRTPIHHSKIELIEPDMKDKTREKIIERSDGKYKKPKAKKKAGKPVKRKSTKKTRESAKAGKGKRKTRRKKKSRNVRKPKKKTKRKGAKSKKSSRKKSTGKRKGKSTGRRSSL